MTDRDSRSAPDNENEGKAGDEKDAVIPGRHGKHGGGMESEGAPQEHSREANEPSKHNGADQNRH